MLPTSEPFHTEVKSWAATDNNIKKFNRKGADYRQRTKGLKTKRRR